MNAAEMKQAMYDFAGGKAEEYAGKLGQTEKDNKNEIKALTIQKNMAQNAAVFLKYEFGGRYYEVRENIVFSFGDANIFTPYRQEYTTLNEEDKKLFLTFAYPFFMVMKNFYLPKKQAMAVETTAEKNFEWKIIVGTLGEILTEWQRLWNAHGCMKCEVFK